MRYSKKGILGVSKTTLYDTDYMNTLSYRTTDDNGLSIELLIDGQPLAKLSPEDEDTKIPYYNFEGDLPLGYWGQDDASIRRIGVCICGIAGCGSTECRVVREGDVIVFRNIRGCVNPHYPENDDGKEFRVTSENYDSVIANIMKEVTNYQTHADQASKGGNS
jgi:hypothetical protein